MPTGIRLRFGILVLTFAVCCPQSVCRGQEIDGLVPQPQKLVGQPIMILNERGTVESGTLTEILQPKDDPLAIMHFELKTERGRTRRFKPEQIKGIRIADRKFSLFPHLPTNTFQLIDIAEANSSINARLDELNRRRSDTHEQDEHEELSDAALADLQKAVKKLSIANQVGIIEGEHVILLTDYPARQRAGLTRFIDAFIPALNEIFGFEPDALVLPGKPIVALFLSRDNLGVFQNDVANNPNYGKIRAFFHLIDGQVIVTAEDDRSVKHACWQAAWGLTGAYARFAYSTVVLPAWIRVGLQQHSADLLVPGLANQPQQRQRVVQEIKGGSLNGLFIADQLPLDRQIVCKAVVAHLYSLSPAAFGQTVNLLKFGRSTDDALSICFGIDKQQFAGSFGRTLGLPQLTP
jgi:hypothetical protein